MIDGGFFERTGWGFVAVEGADTWRFLQDLVSQDLDPLLDGTGAHSLLLDPKGHIVSDFRILRVGDAAWLDTADGPALADALSRYRIRVDVEIADRSATSAVLGVRGSDAVATAADALGATVPGTDHAHAEVPGIDGVRVVRVTWNGEPGLDVVGSADGVAAAAARLSERDVERLDEAAFERLRIEAGAPLFGVDMDGSTLPHEVLLDRDAVSFTKGCFLGQEIVGRIDARGRAPKLMRRIEIPDTSAGVPDAGAELHDADGKVVATLTSVAARPEGGAVGLAVLPVSIEPPGELTIGDGTARVFAID